MHDIDVTWQPRVVDWKHTHEQWQLHCTRQWSSRRCWVSVCTVWPSHSNDWAVEQWICIKYCVKLEYLHGNYLEDSEGHSYGQLLIGSFITTMCLLMHPISCRAFCKTTNRPGDSTPLHPWFGTLRLLAFPKTKITFERKETSDLWWDSGEYDGAADGNWETCVRSLGAHFEEDWEVIVLCTMFLISSSINIYFSYYMAGYRLDIPHIPSFCACS